MIATNSRLIALTYALAADGEQKTTLSQIKHAVFAKVASGLV